MRPPPLLIAGALLFWGACTGKLVLAAAMAAALEGMQRHSDAAKGAEDTNRKKQSAAVAWQTKIEPRVTRLLKAGKTDQDIAGRLSADAGRSFESVRKFVAETRKALTKK